jgi:protocatechuate 3,4-dioxygenase beta subunit
LSLVAFSKPVTRRDALTGIGAAVAAVPLSQVIGCGTPSADTDAGGTGTDAPATDSPATDTPSADVPSTDAPASRWASGGTASMTGDYADPFVAPTAACALTCSMTLGPCYSETVERQDISEGYPGLPVRLALRILDEACEPIVGAEVDVWHTRNSGLYSGSDASDFCTTGDADARAHRYFRGVQTTDAAGRVDFDTCYPGWYASRTVHIHFQVRIGGAEHVTSQLFFPQTLSDEIFASHPDYEAFGAPDTTNTTDSVLGSTDATPYLLDYVRQADGAMLAFKTLIVRTSLATALCSASGRL